ncbi:hypothetical protein D3C87_2150450 [compost metagenome]
MYVDHSIVTLIVNNSTAFSVWVHPNETSTGIALFADAPGVVAESMDVWQLADPEYT